LKTLTADQLQARKDKAVRFLRDVLDDPERADEVEDEDLEDYAERRKIAIVNLGKSNGMANGGNGGNGRTKQDLLNEIDELQQENQDLQDQLDAIGDIIATPDDDMDDDDGGDDQD
jgi:hypothetical protein